MINENALPKVKGQYKFDAKIPNWFDLKGRAEVLFRPENQDDLINFLKNIDSKIPVKIIGAGSNVIIADSGVKGVLIKLPASFSNIEYNSKDQILACGGATLCQNVAQSSINLGITGLEFLSGIPGTIGGAIAMNAGCYGVDVAQQLISAHAIDYQGNFYEINREDFGFYYRGSNISKKFIFIRGLFKVKHEEAKIIAEKIKLLQEQREQSQPLRSKTGGSTFKNPASKKAWELIDAIGYRGKEMGGAKFSEKHCNFLINFNNASSQDLINLGEEARKEIAKRFGINLEWEIKYFD